MTRKDYISIAQSFRANQPDASAGVKARLRCQTEAAYVWFNLRAAIEDVLAADNPRFDRQRFITATEE